MYVCRTVCCCFWYVYVGGGEAGAVGLLSSGGTESILLAVLAYREQGRKERGIEEPEIICALSAHPALFKACAYFGVRLVKARVHIYERYVIL